MSFRPRRSSRPVVAAVLAVLLGLAIYLPLALLVPVPRDGERHVRIVSGTGYGAALQAFHDAGVIPAELPLRILGRLTGVEKSIQPGLYRIEADATPLAVFRRIAAGDIETATLIIPEGWAMDDIAQAAENAGLVTADAFLGVARDTGLARRLRVPGTTFEGFLFPDTYRVPLGVTSEELVRMMVERFWRVFDPALEQGFTRRGLSLLEGVTLASIVEKEARRDDERPRIAAVFLNRLQRGMRLEADPTILYGVRPLGERPIRRSEIHRRTPYNTYVIRGLPPGPIANPGRASLRAVAEPAETKDLYFVARNDGSHQFSATLKEHNRAVRRFRGDG